MRAVIVVFLLMFIVHLNAQITIVANPGEYVPAENYGGKVELKRFLQQEMNYPKTALDSKTEGTVELQFIVDKETGATSDLKISKSVSEELNAEAVRLQQLLLFKPSFYKGDEVTTYRSLKINFSVKQYKKYCKKRGYTEVVYTDDMDKLSAIYPDNQVDIKPKMLFTDTLDNIARFLSRNLQYPEGTRKLNITGTVKLSFVVEPTGRITNIKVLKDVGGGATNETQRLLRLLTWKAGEKDGKKVRVSKIFEVDFNLTNNSGYNYVPTSY